MLSGGEARENFFEKRSSPVRVTCYLVEIPNFRQENSGKVPPGPLKKLQKGGKEEFRKSQGLPFGERLDAKGLFEKGRHP